MGDVIASKDLVVHDDAIGIDRKIFAGQPVPPDLVEAYRAEGGEVPDDYDPAEPQSVPANAGQVIASKDVVVHDAAMGIDRKLIAGQPVPPDLVNAYADETGESVPVPVDETDYDDQAVEALEAEVGRRGLEVDGTGADGNVIKRDLVKALKADDASK